ncbi:MAG: RagB/SusD family nutrient uptake outer membrane protein [Sphingobacteriaceae bacterium]|nr:MAG: RagB/SusD family nutrient uptake outer membrane protein [Sphingobacteriaceae bacterium]
MKNNYLRKRYTKSVIAAFFSAMLVFSSCEVLDVKPNDVIQDKDFLKSYYDAEFLLRGAYQGLQPIVEPWFVLGELRADWVKPGPGADKDMLELAEHRVTPENKYTNWTPYYDLINRANYMVQNLPRVPKNPNYFNETTMRQYTGEARFLRALAYFHLVRNFGDVPFTLESTDDISKVKYPAPTSQEVILDAVEADLLEAYKYTDLQISVLNTFDAGLRVSPEQSRLRVTRGTVCALQAEVYLWRNKYDKAKEACVNFQRTELYPFALNERANWMDIFTIKNLFNEPMFEVNFSFVSREFNPLMRITSNDAASGGKYMVAPSDVAIKTYNPTYPVISTTDVVKDDVFRGFGASFAGSAPFYNRLGSAPVIWKYIGLGRVAPATIDVPPNVRPPYESEALWHVYRQGDLYLLYAEALNRLGDKAGAITMINRIRNRAGVPLADATTNTNRITTTSTTEQIENVILRERGLESGFEGRRWYDLIRMARHQGKPDVLINAVKNRAPVSMHAYLDSRLRNSNYWYLPYNSDEIRLNPNLKQKVF